jgi:hypothetical protein
LEKDIAEGLLYAIQLSPWWWWVIKHQLGEHQTGVITVEIPTPRSWRKNPAKIIQMQQNGMFVRIEG